jgi:hypothetical protein
MRLAFGVTVAAFVLASGQAMAACDGKVIVLQDHFDSLSKVWSWSDTGTVSVEDGKLEVKTKSGKSDKVFASPHYKDIDLCADMEVTSGSNLSSIYYGIGFWATDNSNLYTFQVSPTGNVGVFRLADDEWSTVVDEKTMDEIHQGRDAVNSLRVVTEGDKARFYVNGTQFGETYVGNPPSDGQLVGFVVQASDQSSATFHFDEANAVIPE